MPSFRLKVLNALLPIILKFPLRISPRPTRISRAVVDLASIFMRMPKGVSVSKHMLANGQISYRVDTGGRGTLIYFHGGAYMMGSPKLYIKLAARMGKTLGLNAVIPAYRLAPEHPFPAAVDDACDAYLELAPQGDAIIAGDSAGGGLALALVHRLGAKGLPRPRAVIAFSPWADLTLQSESITRNAATDVSIPVKRMQTAVNWYADGADPRNPEMSPVFGSFAGAGPVVFQVSDVEAVLDDSHRMTATLQGAGVPTKVQVWQGCPHVWQIFQGYVPEADAAIDALPELLREVGVDLNA